MTKISFVSQTDGELYVDTEKVATITANVPCKFELPKGAYQFRLDVMQTDDEVTMWWPITAFDLRLNGFGSVDIRLESWDKVHVTRLATVRGIPFSRMERPEAGLIRHPKSMPHSSKPVSRRSKSRMTR